MSSLQRKKILVFIDWYLPGYKAGGPIQSVANIVARLKDNFEFAIITSDTDEKEIHPYSTIKSDEWNTLAEGTRVYYFSQQGRKFVTLKKIMLAEQADAIYLNSLFSVFFTMYPLIIRKYFLPSRKTILAPRGMLGKGALEIKSTKKKLFLMAARITGLYKNITWHASTELEEKEIALNFGRRQKIIVATNLTSLNASTVPSRSKEVGKVDFVFLSRLSAKKNLLSTVNTLNRLPDTLQVLFDIYGPIDDAEYWEKCKQAISKAPPHVKINYKGAIANTDARKILSKYHFSLLQTQHENFGHSIIESMAAGCPVVISDQTPWRNLAELNAGWDIGVNDEATLLHTLTTCAEMNQQTFNTWSSGAFNFADKVINNPKLIDDNKKLFA